MIKNSNKKTLGRRKISLDEDAEDALYFSQVQEHEDAVRLAQQLQEGLDKNRSFGYIEDFNNF